MRAVGESPQSAHAIGYPVMRIRYLAVMFGGACAGLGGAYLAVAYTPLWVEGMTAGRGWIALALVVFATWRPWRVLVGAYLFGGVTLAQFQAQALGVDDPVAVPVDAALPRDHRRAGDHLARRGDDPAQRAGVARQAVPSRRLTGGVKSAVWPLRRLGPRRGAGPMRQPPIAPSQPSQENPHMHEHDPQDRAGRRIRRRRARAWRCPPPRRPRPPSR